MNILKNSKKYNSFFAWVLICLFLFVLPFELFAKGAGSKKTRPRAFVTAQAAYAVDYTNRKVIFSRNIRQKFYPASTVKLLTALVVLDHKDLDDSVLISRVAVNVEPTKAGLTKGAYYTVGDLLRVLLATSANDAAVALAESVSGTEAAFAVLMNKKAKRLGLRDSHFMNATGLPNKKQVMSVYDLSVLTRSAFSQPFIKAAMAKKSVTIKGSDKKIITRANHNKLLWRVSEPCVLGKTGYTISAGHCYAGIAYYDEKRISIVMMKSRKPWADICAILGIKTKKKK